MFLGIDVGTSAVKICVVDAAGSVIAQQERSYPISYPFDGASEQNCEDWWASTVKAISELPKSIKTQVEGIGLSGQMHGAVFLDKDDRPIRPAILWNDARSAPQCSTLLKRTPNIADVTGVWPMPGFTAPKILWIAEHEASTHKRIATILLPKDFIGFKLHGQRVTDPSDAAGTSWFDQRNRIWSTELCAASATQTQWLPEIRYGNEVAGYLLSDVAEVLDLPTDIPIAVGAGDAAAGAIGVGAVSTGDGFISLGTSGQLFVTQDSYKPNIDARLHTYAHTHSDHFFKMGAMLNGARPISWLSELLDLPIADLLARAEASEPDDLIFLPYLTGERTPHGDSTLRGAFYGLSETTTTGNLMRAVVEAIAFTFADAALAFERSGTPVPDLMAIGGGTKSDFLMQTISDVLGIRIGRSDSSSIGPALGAARLAQMAVGNSRSIADIAFKPKIQKWFEPNFNSAKFLERKLAAYRAIVPGLAEARSILASGT